MLETFSDNPFLINFYKNQKEFALATQLQFLLNRSKVFARERKDFFASNNIVSDFLMKKDKLFAETILNKEELSLYSDIRSKLDFYEPKPDLVIYLQANINILLNRIQKRGETYEYQITSDYLGSIVNAYSKYFHSYEESPLLVINTSNVDVINQMTILFYLTLSKKILKERIILIRQEYESWLGLHSKKLNY